MKGIEEIRTTLISEDFIGPAGQRAALEAQARYLREIRRIFDLPDDAPVGPWKPLQ